MAEIMNALKKRAESICTILFYAASALCFFYYVGNFGGDFMPVMGNLFALFLEVGLWLVIPLLLTLRKRSIAKWAFLGISIYWLLTTLFNLLGHTGFAGSGKSALSCAIGVFAFLLASDLIVMAVMGVLSVLKKERKWKRIALFVYVGALLFFLVTFSLLTAYYANRRVDWNEYFYLLYVYLALPFAMIFAAIAFWFDGNEFMPVDLTTLSKAIDESESAPSSDDVLFEEDESPKEEDSESK